MNSINRRSFLKTAALASAALALPVRSWSQVPGANETIRAAVVGVGGRGEGLLKEILSLSKTNIRVVALCDVDQKALSKAAAQLKDKGLEVQTYTDIRKLLENKNVDTLTIATPNHWHALATLWAVQAGKDVYVEKPVSHNVLEGRRMVEAARKYNKIVQTGTQSRSSRGIREAVEWVQKGNLGKMLVARGMCYKPRASIGKASGNFAIPETIDYDLWCGPAEKLPIHRGRLHYDWHWVWNTGNGDLGNQGIHQMDIARWFLGEKELAPRVFSVGGRLGYEDDGETPNSLIVYQDYDKTPLIFEVRGLPAKTGAKDMDQFLGSSVGVVIECEGGHVLVPDYNKAIVFDMKKREMKTFEGTENHHGNFFKAVRSRTPGDLNADILEGHLSSALCHTGNISYRLGKNKNPKAMREALQTQRDAIDTLGRLEEHLGRNGVDLKKTPLTLGAFLAMDPKTEKFTNNKKANELLTRPYRAPFVVPESV